MGQLDMLIINLFWEKCSANLTIEKAMLKSWQILENVHIFLLINGTLT